MEEMLLEYFQKLTQQYLFLFCPSMFVLPLKRVPPEAQLASPHSGQWWLELPQLDYSNVYYHSLIIASVAPERKDEGVQVHLQ